MKRVLSILLAACLCCGLLAGCGEKEEGEVEKTEFQTEDMEVDDALEAYSLSIPKVLVNNCVGNSVWRFMQSLEPLYL